MSNQKKVVNSADQNGSDLATDLIWGIDKIGKEIGRSPRATFYLLDKGLLPARKAGGRWIASRRALRAHFAFPTSPAA